MFGFNRLNERIKRIERDLKEANRISERIRVDKECDDEDERIGEIKEPHYIEYFGGDSHYVVKLRSCSRCVVLEEGGKYNLKCIATPLKGNSWLTDPHFIKNKPKLK